MRLSTQNDLDTGVSAIDSLVESYVQDRTVALDISKAVVLRLIQMGWKPVNREEGK